MARTRQQAKQRQAKRRKEQQAQGTTGPKPPSNPAEQAVVRQAEAYEVGDVLEEAGGDVEEAAERLEEELSDEVIAPVEAPEPREAPLAPTAPEPTAPEPTRRKERKPKPSDGDRDGRGGKGGRGGGSGRGGTPRRERRPEPRKREPRQRSRVVNFLIQVWAELRRVQWPDRNAVTQATSVVIVFCLLAGFYLALWDWIFSKLVKAIL
jgi:preprotein translocase subunit SecE